MTKLPEADVDFWAERFGANSKAIERAIKLAKDALIQAVAWGRDASEDQWAAKMPALLRNTLNTMLEAGAIGAQAMAANTKIEQTITGPRGGKQRQADLERIKRRAALLQLLEDTIKPADN